jgi:hypothetical protein
MANLTTEQRDKVLRLSREAQSFLQSELYKELKSWAITEQQLTGSAMALDTRNKEEEKLTRAEFVERKSGYYISVGILLGVIQRYATHEKELLNIEEHEANKSK